MIMYLVFGRSISQSDWVILTPSPLAHVAAVQRTWRRGGWGGVVVWWGGGEGGTLPFDMFVNIFHTCALQSSPAV